MSVASEKGLYEVRHNGTYADWCFAGSVEEAAKTYVKEMFPLVESIVVEVQQYRPRPPEGGVLQEATQKIGPVFRIEVWQATRLISFEPAP